ncbi:tol-pal system protein YbgF [Sneathiella aquimaris]|uniref:tol-pal system protein YbgF n=1 Tax=Sneathiella aquimaris TaxID=2599305 RepID=UPI00146A929F|nr:tol-pal system protein YbgF [Sneathiella aquimaris]
MKEKSKTGHRHSIVLIAFAATTVLFSTLAFSSAQAQSSDVQALLDRINRLEADLTNVQRKVFQGQDVPAPTVSSGGGAIAGGEAAALLSSRIDALESEQRRATGNLEEITFKLDQLKNRLDKLVLDIDFRLTDIERRLNGGQSIVGQNTVPASNLPLTGTAPQNNPQSATADNVSRSASGTAAAGLPKGTRLLGTLRVPADGTAPVDTAAPANESAPSVAAVAPTENLDPAAQYNQAFSMLSKDDFAGAEQAFAAFLQSNKEHELAGNAQYWLGETYYVRGDYPNAASSFLNGYQNYPDSSKAADNLLKLAMTLGRMEQKEEACATFQQLEKQFNNLSSRLKRIAGLEKQKFGCQ